MSDEILDDFLKKLRETGETTGVPGIFDRATSSENPDLSQNLNIGRVAERAKSGIIDTRGREREVGGKVYTNPERSEYIPYYKDATDALINPTALNVAGNAAPYYGTIAAGALIPGGLFAELGTVGTAAIGAQATGQAIGQAAGFLGGSYLGGAGIAAGLDKFNLGPTAYENLTQPGALGLTQTGVGLTTFRPGLPPGGLTAAQLKGAGIFSGVVAAEEVGRAGINAAMGTEERSPAKILADTALHAGEAFAFGSLMKPTALGAGLIGMGHNMANAGNVVPSMVASGVFKVGEMPTDMPVGGKFVRNNTQGRGGVMMGKDGKLIAVDESELANSVPGSSVPSVRTEAGAPVTPKPSPTGRGDATIFDPTTGAGLRITVTPDGNVQYTMFTNLGGAALKAKGPYKDLPNVFNVDQNAQIKLNFEARMADYEARRRAAEQAAAANAPVDVTATTPGPDPQLGNRTPVVPEPPKPVAPNTPPPAVTPAEAVAGGTAGTNVDPLLRAAQSRHDAAQEAERQAGRNLTKAGEDYAQAIRDEADNPGPESRQRRLDANQREKDALIALEKAQAEAEAASRNLSETKKGLEEAAAQREADKDKVEPRPDIAKNYEGWAEWGRKYEFTNDPTTGRKLTTEESAKAKENHEAYVELAKAKSAFKDANPGNEDLPEGQRRIFPRDSLKTELAKQKWDIIHGDKYNPDGTPKGESPAQAVITPPSEPKPAEPKPTTTTPTTDVSAEERERTDSEKLTKSGFKKTEAKGLEAWQDSDGDVIVRGMAGKRPVYKVGIFGKAGMIGPMIDATAPSAVVQTLEEAIAVVNQGKAERNKKSAEIAPEPETKPLTTSGERPPDLRQFTPATREEVLSGARPAIEAPRSVLAALTAEERKTMIRNRKQFLETGEKPKFDIPPPVAESPKPVVTENTPPAGVGETVVEPTSNTAGAKEAPVTASSPVDTPVVAATKIDDEIERLVDLGDAKTAADVKAKVVNTLTELLKEEQKNPTKPLDVVIPTITSKDTGIGKADLVSGGTVIGSVTKTLKTYGSGRRYASLTFSPKIGSIKGLEKRTYDRSSEEAAKNEALRPDDIAEILDIIKNQITDYTKIQSDNRKYVIRIPGDGTFSVRRNEKAIVDVLNRIDQGAADVWKGVVGRPKTRAPSSSQLRGPKFSPKLTAQDKKQLQDLILEEESHLASKNDEWFKWNGTTRQEVIENVENLKKALAEGGGKPDAQPSEIPDMTSEQHWDVERDREEAAQKTRTPRATEAPETAKTKAQIDAEAKSEGAKKYGASGVRFNIGGPKNPESFGGEIRGQKGVVVETNSTNWNEKDLKLIKDYLSKEAEVLRNGGYPKFYFNSQISGEDSNWVSAPVPAANGNFLIYEVNPKGSGASGNSYKRTVRLFRRLVNSDGKQIGSMTEVSQGELVGMSTISLAEDGKPLFQVPAIFHAMMRAAQDSLASREMTESSVNYGGDVTNPNPLNARIALSGSIHEDLSMFEENGLTPGGLRDKMEVFNALKGGEAINSAIVGFLSSPDVASSSLLSSQLQTNGLLAAADAESFIAELAAAMGMEPGTYALVTSPHDDELYPILKRQGIYPTEARLMLKWIQNGYQRIIFEVGKHDPETGLELPDKVPARLPNGDIRYLPKPGPNGEKVPMMVNNPQKWKAPVTQWMTAEDFTVRDKDGNITFQPKPHQVVGPNMAMTRWFPAGIESTPRDLKVGMPKAILINDAPGTGKTLQMLMAAVLYRKQLEKLAKDPTSKWYGQKLQPVLIVTQNAQIIQNAFKGDAAMAGIELNGKFTPEGFEPDEYEDTPEGRILKGNSWIDIATYSSIKPTEEKVLLFEKDGKTPKMVNALVRNEAGNPVKGPDGKYQIAYHPTEVDDKGIPVPLKEQAFRMVRVGPPKKGAGKWGAVMFDESHNMKNDTSARSDAGFEIMSKSQHVMLASGTPIDKPTQLGPILGMLLDMPMEEIAAKLGMKLSTTKRSDDVLLRKRGPDDGAPIMEKPKLEYGTMPADPIEREKAYNNLFIKLRALRDEAGKAGAILRRSTKYFGVDNIWLDPTDSFHQEGKKALLALQTWWFNEMALGAEGETGMNPRNMRGMLLFESKRLTSLIKCGIPNTPWNPSDEPKGAAKLMLDEIKEGRKVIITMDTSNPFNLDDSVNIRRFRGLKTTEGAPLPYESEAVLWGRYLDKLGIKFGSITGDFSIAEREVTVREFQKNNPDLQVIIMTTQSGGTGLSIDDRHGVGGKTNPKKQYTDAEIARMKQVGAEEIEGEKIPSGSFPRTMIIVSSPWGGDVFIQAMGRTDRVLATTPSRIIVMTSHISEGDEKLADLVRMKTMATNAINETGDELAAAVMMDAAENGAGMHDADGIKPVKELGGVRASNPSADSVSEDVKYFKNKAKQTLKRNISTAKGIIADNKQKIADSEKNNSTNREITRWKKTLDIAEAYVKRLTEISEKLEDGSFDYKSIVKHPDDYSFETFKNEDLDVDGMDEDGFFEGNQLSIDLPIGKSLLGRQGLPADTGALARKGKPSRARQVIDKLYGVNHQVSGGKVTEEQLKAIENTVVDIISPFVKNFEEGKMSGEKLKSLMRMASDVAFLVHRYEFIFKEADVNVHYGGQTNFAARAIMKLFRPETMDKISTVYHEIGHALWDVLNDTDKQRIIDEMLQARKHWLGEMSQGSPMRALVLPEVDFREPQGFENTSFAPVDVEKAPVPYSRKRKYTAVGQRFDTGLLKNVPNAATIKNVIGTGLASKAVMIALKNAALAGWKTQKSLPFAFQDPMYKEFFGSTGQIDIIEHGKTPAERATKALMAVFQARMIRNTEAANDKMDITVNRVDALDMSTGQPVQNAALSLKDIYYLITGGRGVYDISEDGSLEITTRVFLSGSNGNVRPSWKITSSFGYNTSENISKAPGMIRYKIPGSMVYSMFESTFGGMSPTSKNADLIFQNPDFQTATFCTQANNVAEVASGIADQGMIGHNYKFINVDEWLANNTEELFNDFYSLNEPDDFTGLTASITSSLFTHASAGGYGSVAKSIVAGLVGGTIQPVFDEPAMKMSGTQWHADKVRNKMDAQAAANAPPETDIDGNTFSIDKDPMVGPARRKFESAVEGLNAIAASLAETALDFNVIKDSSAMRAWFEQARRRKRLTGKPDNVTGFGINYKFAHIYGTLIGQVEQIAEMTRDPYVLELSKRLYPTPGTGLNVRSTYTEDVYAHTAFWNNRFNDIIRRNLGEKIAEAKDDKIRKIEPGAENLPGFVDAMAQYILKAHNPIFNRLERIQFEIDAVDTDPNGNKKIPAPLAREIKSLGLASTDWRGVQQLIDAEIADAKLEASRFGKGSSYDKVALGREADAFLGEYMEKGGIDKLMMDVGRCMAIPKDSPEYATRTQRFEPEVIAAADELIDQWSSSYIEWSRQFGDVLAEWGSSWVPRIADSNLIASYGNASGDDFVLTAAQAMLEDNKFQRVRLPSSLKTPIMDMSVSSQFVKSSKMPHVSKSEVMDFLRGFIDPQTGQDTFQYPQWMISRAQNVLTGGTQKESFMGFDVSCVNEVDGKLQVDVDPVSGARVEKQERTTIGHHIAANLHIYRVALANQAIASYGSVSKALRIESFRREYEMVGRVIGELSESHQRKVLAGPLSKKDAIAIAKKWRERVEHRASGVQASGQGYADLFGGQHGTMKTPDSMKQRQMDTAAADKILERFYIRDPRIFGPNYNQSVTRNLMLKKHIPEGFFERMQKSIISNPDNRRFWPEITYLMAKITDSQPGHDSSTLLRSMVTFAAATTFMSVTAGLQLSESMPAGLHSPHGVSSDSIFKQVAGLTSPGARATAETVKIGLLKAANATIRVGAMLTRQAVDNNIALMEIDKFMYRLAERTGIIMSTYMDDIPQSSADPRGFMQRYTDKLISRYHRNGNALSTVTDISRVAVLKANVMMLETTADEILMRELTMYGKNGAKDEVEFAKLLKPLEAMLLRNLGIPDSHLKPFLKHALITRAITEQDISKIPSYMIESTIRTLVDSAYEDRNVEAQLYSNALNRLNMLSIQRSNPATISRLRGLVDRHVGVFAGSNMFFLTNFSSAFGRNIVLPASRIISKPFYETKRVLNAGDQEPKQFTPSGTYLTNRAYPLSPTIGGKMLPAIAMMMASTSFVNYYTRQARMELRSDPASTYTDERTWLMKSAAAIDQAGFTANLSLPLNVAQALRYQREAAQIASGPFWGNIAGVVDMGRTLLSDKNSENTPTAERAFAKITYDTIIRPVGQAVTQMLTPNNILGDAINLAATQYMALPSTRESFMRWFADDAGNQGKRVPVSKADLLKAYQKNLITREQYMQGIRERTLYDSQYDKEKAIRERNEAFQRRKESQGK